MTRLELAKKRAEKLEKAQSNIKNEEDTQTTNDTSKASKRLELAKQRASAIESEYKKAQEQQDALNDYIDKNGAENILNNYGNYLQSVGQKINSKVAQSDSMQDLLSKSKENVITASEVQKESDKLSEFKKQYGIEGDSLTKAQENLYTAYQRMQKKAEENNYTNSRNVVNNAIARMTDTTGEKDTFFQMPENLKDNLRYFEDGYQFGDLIKSSAETTKEFWQDVGSTAFEGAIDFTRGGLSAVENISNAGASVIAGVSDLVGQDDFANALRKQVAKGSPFSDVDNLLNNASEWYGKNSFTGEILDQAMESTGQTYAQLLMTAGLDVIKAGNVPIKFGKHVLNIPTTAFLGGMGSTASETYAEAEQQLGGIENATWKEKVQMALRILRGGTLEGVTEGMFGLFGIGGSDITDEWAKKAVSKATDSFQKQLIKVAIAGGGEAVEEFVSYTGNWLFDKGFINKIGNLDFSQDYDWDEVFNEMTAAFLSAGMSQGGSAALQINKATKVALNNAEQIVGRELTSEEKTQIKNNISDIVLEATEELENTVNMYPTKQTNIDNTNIQDTVSKNNAYLRNKYKVSVDEQGQLIQDPRLSKIDRLKQKYNIKRDEYNKPIVQNQVDSTQNTSNNVQLPNSSNKLAVDTATQNDYTKINLGETVNIPTSKLMELYTSGGERTTEQISTLKEDIKNNGITEPIEISQNSDGTYQIENGNHRLQIASELGIEEVPVKLVESWDSFVSRIQNKEARTEYGVNTITNRTNTSNEESGSSSGVLRNGNRSSESGRGTTTDAGISTGTSNSNKQTSSYENQRINREKNTIENSKQSSFSSVQDIVKPSSTIQGLEDYSEQDIKNIISDYVEDLTSDVKISNVKIGTSQENGLNVTIEYDGNISQEELNNILNQEPLTIDGVNVNINTDDLNLFDENKDYNNVDITTENDYNGYRVTRKNEPNNYVYKRITEKDKARVNSDYMTNKAKYEDDVGVVNFDDASYAYEKVNGEINVLGKFKGSQKFINDIEEAWKNGIDDLSNRNTKVVESIRSIKRKSNISNDNGRKQGKSRTSDRKSVGYGRQQRNTNITKTIKNNGNNLENSNKSSFSLQENQDTAGDNTQEYEYTNEKEKLHIERAEEIFGYTDDFEKAGYLTWDGELLDFSNGSDRRIEDHRAINQVFDETFDTNSEYLIKFMNEGNIRINPETPGLEISNFTEPSNAQLDMIEEYADWNKYGGYFVVDFCNKYGDNIGSLEYENNINPSQVIDDINEFFRTGELPNVEETNKQYDNQITIEDTLRTKMYYKSNGNKPVVVAQRYWNGFEKKGYIDLNGKTVRDAQDVAELSQIFRNPQYETARVIYVKGDTIVGQEAVSSHLPNSSAMFTDKNRSKAFYKMEDRMKRLNADGYYMVHNHPSGTAKASQQDVKLTKTVSSNVDGFKGHIIVDHGTYAYIYKGFGGDIDWQNELKVSDKNALYKGSTFETVLQSDKVPWSEKINSRDDLASLMYNLKNSSNYSSLILSDTNNRINAIIDIPNGFFNMRASHVEGYIKNVSKQYGTVKAYIGTSDSNVFNKLNEISILQDAILYKNNQKQFAEPKGSNLVFKPNEQSVAVRTAEETKDERVEKVRKYIEEFQKNIGTLGAEVNRKDIVSRIVEEYGITTKGNSKELNKVATDIQKLFKDGSLTDQKIEGYAEYLVDNLKVTIDDFYSANKELKELIRQTKLYASDTVKNGFTDWGDFRKQNFGTLRLTNDKEALPIDTFYKELTEIYGEEFFPSHIANISDQIGRISEVAKQIKIIDQTLRENIQENFGEDAIEEIKSGLIQNLKTWREKVTQENLEESEKENSKPDEIKERSWTKTAQNNGMVAKFLDIQTLNYVVQRNTKTVAQANGILEIDGYEKALDYIDSIFTSNKFPKPTDIALAERLIQEATKRGEWEKATELISDVAIMGTQLGQSVQAMSIISRLSPTGQLLHLRRSVEKINDEIKRKNKKALKEFKGLEITPEMEMEILSSTTPEELEMAMTRIKEQLASKMPVEWSEKLASWRYLSMLGNPKTHIRNILGNFAMGKVLYAEKNVIQRIVETTFDSKLEERTRTFKKPTQAVKDFAEAMLEENKEALSGNGYTNLQNEIKSMRKTYKWKALQWFNEKNSNMLELEDFWAKKPVFKSALAEYLTANGIKTEQDIEQNKEIVQKGINFAVDEALKATFNQYNAVATAINRFENSSKIGEVLVGGLAPFKRTPMNIVKTSWQYSPLGLIETLTLQTKNLKNGLINANEYIERVSQGLTGASITVIGFLMASAGLLTGSTGSGKEDEFRESIGLFAPYSIHIPNTDIYIDISWLAPLAVPLLMGSELYYALKDEGEKGTLKNIGATLEVLERSMNPVSEMTMLKNINDALINYGGDNSIDGIAAILTTAMVSYVGQFFPTLGYQINKIIDKTIRSTSASQNSAYKTGERAIRQALNKIPGTSSLLEPSLDHWGNVRERSDNAVLRAVDSLANPSTVTTSTATKVDKEILKLYEKNGNDDIFPTTPQKYFTAQGEKYEMSASEYTQYKMTYGQTAYNKIEKLIKTAEYKTMSNEEKEEAITNIYEYAKQIAKYDYLTNLYGKTKGLKKLLGEDGYQKYKQASVNLGINYETYLETYYKQKDETSDKDEDGETIKGTEKENKIKAIQDALPSLTEEEATILYQIYAGRYKEE